MSDNKRKYHILKAPELRTLKECDGLGLEVIMQRMPYFNKHQIRRHAAINGVTIIEERPNNAKYSISDIEKISALKKSGLSWEDIAKMYNEKAANISRAVNRRVEKLKKEKKANHKREPTQRLKHAVETIQKLEGAGLEVMMKNLPELTEKDIRAIASGYGISVINRQKPYGAKYSDDEIATICELKNTGLTWAEIAVAYNTTAVSIKHCVNRRLRKGVA